MTGDPGITGGDHRRRLHGRRVAVTGAAGFIGGALVRELAGIGAEVVAIDALVEAPYPASVREAAWESNTMPEGVEGRRLDLRSDRLGPALSGVEVVFHLAAVAGMADAEADGYRSCNVEGTARLAEACREAGVTRLVHASTSAVYGEVATGDEDSPLKPNSDYGLTKLQAERLLSEIAGTGGFDLTILRLFSVYGPGQRPDMAYFRLIEAALGKGSFTVFGDGSQSRSNTYVGDVIDSFIRATAPAATGETMNIAGGEAVTLNHAIETIERLTGSPIERLTGPSRPGDQLRTEGDWSRARDLIGFEPRTSFEEGITRQIEWQSAALLK